VGERRSGALPLARTPSVAFGGLTPIKSTLDVARRPNLASINAGVDVAPSQTNWYNQY
jgi:hypothetical protein